MSQNEPKENAPITVRLEPELADFVRGIADATCNTTSGALRLCVRTVKKSGLSIADMIQAAKTPEPELAAAG